MSRYEEELESQNEQLLARIAELEEENDKLKETLSNKKTDNFKRLSNYYYKYVEEKDKLKEYIEEKPPKWKDTLIGDVSAVRMWGEEYLRQQMAKFEQERQSKHEQLYGRQ